MGKYILKRILIAIPVLIGITIIDYAIMCLAGSPLEMLQGPRISEGAIEAKKIVEYQDNNIIFNIKSLQHKKRKPKQLDINDIDVKGDR